MKKIKGLEGIEEFIRARIAYWESMEESEELLYQDLAEYEASLPCNQCDRGIGYRSSNSSNEELLRV